MDIYLIKTGFIFWASAGLHCQSSHTVPYPKYSGCKQNSLLYLQVVTSAAF